MKDVAQSHTNGEWRISGSNQTANIRNCVQKLQLLEVSSLIVMSLCAVTITGECPSWVTSHVTLVRWKDRAVEVSPMHLARLPSSPEVSGFAKILSPTCVPVGHSAPSVTRMNRICIPTVRTQNCWRGRTQLISRWVESVFLN